MFYLYKKGYYLSPPKKRLSIIQILIHPRKINIEKNKKRLSIIQSLIHPRDNI